jgi:hypothetical protein
MNFLQVENMEPSSFLLKRIEAMIDMRLDIEPRLQKQEPILETKFIKRVLVFTLSSTCIVDLKSKEKRYNSIGYKI